MKSNVFLLKELKGTKVNLTYGKKEYKNATFVDFDLQGKVVYIREDNGPIEMIYWYGSEKFHMTFLEPEILDDLTDPTSLKFGEEQYIQ